ncbi:MAG: hypothetical protein LBE18_08760, partial [Planctomycetaceae bacterium]|nr:hypothetical protein [Planctomycetaceae bacterium]
MKNKNSAEILQLLTIIYLHLLTYLLTSNYINIYCYKKTMTDFCVDEIHFRTVENTESSWRLD